MSTEISFRERISRLCLTIAGQFKAVLDPSASWPARLKSLTKAMLVSGAIMAALFVAYAIALIPFTPSIADLRKAKAETPSILMSSDGEELFAFRRTDRQWVELEDISPHIINALIATEDHRFYQHFGIDFKRTAAGLLRTLQGDPEGGSTLTQQLARNLYPEQIGRKRTITRKLKEAITALKIEYAYSKQEILLTYLNTMPFLYNAFGIEMGARTYFGKPAAKLNVLESATLVGMLKGTSYYNPVLNPERARQRRNVVLSQMARHGMLGKAEFERLKNRPIRLDFERQHRPETFGKAPHFASHVRKWLIEWADRNDYNLYSDGLVIHSTIDARLQQFAEQAMKRHMQELQQRSDAEKGIRREGGSASFSFYDLLRWLRLSGPGMREELLDAFVRESDAYRSAVEGGTPPEHALKQLKRDTAFMSRLSAEKTRLETGFVAIDPATGQVKAWIGSRSFEADQFDHVAQARRQPGSTFKPFVYGAALEHGMSPQTRFTDGPVEIALPNGSIWRPSDASAPSGQPLTLRDALAYSKNTITAQVMQKVGAQKVISFARRAGVQSALDPVPALSLGTSPVSLLEMVSAYGTLAAGGEFRQPVLIDRITDRDGKLLEGFASESRRAISAKTAYDLTDMLRGTVNDGTGRAIRSRFGIDADLAGKTGTTQGNTDGWFILMHPRLVAGAWVGFNDARVTMGSQWGTGAQAALPIVGEFYRHALQSRLADRRARFEAPPQSPFGSVGSKLANFFNRQTGEPEPQPEPAQPPTRRSPPVRISPQAQPQLPRHEPQRSIEHSDMEEEATSDEHDGGQENATEDGHSAEPEPSAGTGQHRWKENFCPPGHAKQGRC